MCRFYCTLHPDPGGVMLRPFSSWQIRFAGNDTTGAAMVSLENAAFAAAALLVPIGILFMVACRTAWVKLLDSNKQFQEESATLKSKKMLSLFGSLVTNYVFLFALMIFSVGVFPLAMLLGAPGGFACLCGVSPFAVIMLQIFVTQCTPIGIPSDNHFVPPPPALVVLGLAEGLLVGNAISKIESGVYAVTGVHYAMLSVVTLLPLLIGLWHRQRGWMNQPDYHWP